MKTETGHYLVLSISIEKGGKINFIGFGNFSELPNSIEGHPLSYYQGENARVIAIAWDIKGTSPMVYELKEHKVSNWELTNRD